MDSLSATPNGASGFPQPSNGDGIERPDVEMKEETQTYPASMASADPAPVGLPHTTEHPSTSSQPQSRPLTPARASTTLPPPTQPNPHGSPTRVYLNQNVTPYLLEGMKYLAVYEPDKPLKWLSEYLAKRSQEVEGS